MTARTATPRVASGAGYMKIKTAFGRSIGAALAWLAAVAPAFPQPAPREAVEQAEALRLADAWLESIAAYQNIPAISAGVVVDERLVWARGYGTLDADHKVAATPRTIYSICSISKLFTSVGLMQLYEAGKVRLDEPVATYLPWAKLTSAEADSGPVTLRAVLSHSGGLPRDADLPYWTAPDFTFPTQAQLRGAVGAQASAGPASRYYRYSNLGLALVGETVEAVSGEAYGDYMQGQVLGPLGLTDTRTSMPVALQGVRLAVGYGALKRDGSRDRLAAFDARAITPAAGYTSTVEDLARFAAWQLRLLRTGKAEVLKASTLREMQRVQFVDPASKRTRGLGFAISTRGGRTFVGHEGNCPGHQSVLSLEPASGRAVIVMNNASESPEPWAEGIFALLDRRKGFAFQGALPAVDLEAYAGRYSEQPYAAESVMVPWAGGLAYVVLPSSAPAAELQILKPKGGDVFRRVRDDGSEADEFRFVRDTSGKVVRFIYEGNPVARLPAVGGGRP